jgi:hypothetical protein
MSLLRICISFMAILVLVSRVSAVDLHFTVGDVEQDYLNQLHHPEAIQYARDLETIFLELDANADGQLDGYEMKSLEHEGRISDVEHTLLKAFDLDGSGDVSQAELTFAPLTLNMLETAVDVEEPGMTQEMRSAEAAFEGLDVPSTPTRRLKNRRTPVDVGQDEAVLAELSSSIPPAGTPRVKSAGGKRGNTPLPVSLFGVPSVSDEECVICQYFVQRIQNGVADRLENGPGASAATPPAGGEGLPGGAAAAQKALAVRNTNSQLQKKPGGRGIVRVIAEDIIQALCAVDKMPLLFNPYCSGFTEPNAINAVRKGIFFNIPTVEVCSQAALCRDDSYINTNAAVHATKTSLFLNGQRGICGMLGGSRDRVNSREGQLLNAVCAAHGAVFGNPDQA